MIIEAISNEVVGKLKAIIPNAFSDHIFKLLFCFVLYGVVFVTCGWLFSYKLNFIKLTGVNNEEVSFSNYIDVFFSLGLYPFLFKYAGLYFLDIFFNLKDISQSKLMLRIIFPLVWIGSLSIYLWLVIGFYDGLLFIGLILFYTKSVLMFIDAINDLFQGSKVGENLIKMALGVFLAILFVCCHYVWQINPKVNAKIRERICDSMNIISAQIQNGVHTGWFLGKDDGFIYLREKTPQGWFQNIAISNNVISTITYYSGLHFQKELKSSFKGCE